MSAGDMVQIHMLTSYPATLLNRDDVGLAKRVPFGGVLRTRISSQCLKKHWRETPEVTELGELADRSTRVFEVRVAKPLQAQHGATEDEATAIAQFLMSYVQTKAEKKGHPLQTGQLLVLTRAETRFLLEEGARILARAKEAGEDAADAKVLERVSKIDRDTKKLLRALPASLDTALFGRMVTSDYFARVDAAVSVAHAFTTHEEASETDYFTAVDTLKDADDDAGAGLIQDTELTSGVFYVYAVIDMNQLRGNLSENGVAAEHLSRNLARVMAMCSPGAKRGSTAPYAYAEFTLFERGRSQPRTLANAFRTAIRADGADQMQASVEALMEHRHSLERMYGVSEGTTAVSSIQPLPEGAPPAIAFDDALDAIFGGEE